MNVIIGAGISGLSAGQALQGDFVILEKSAVPGGLSGQYQAGGFAFDYGGHYFHFQGKPEIRKHVESFQAFREYRRNSKILLMGRFIPYSLQYHLAYLPAALRRVIVAEITAGCDRSQGNLDEFLRAGFGPQLHRLFFAPYLEKFYRRPLTELIAGMDKGSIPIPSLDEVVAGARGRRLAAEGYNPFFYYPQSNLQDFMVRYSQPVRGRIRFRETVVRVEAESKRVITNNGVYRYENLLSTLPLNELLRIMSPPPPVAARQLHHVSTLVANAVLARRRRRFHWLYLPEKTFPFYRAGYYPTQGVAAVYLEKTIPPGAALDTRQLFAEVSATLRRTGMIAGAKEILFLDLKRIPVSYIVFDRHWPKLVPSLLARLRGQHIHSIGRFGSWNYTSMADDIRSAREAAAWINRG